jgi:hypothetical protein
MDRQQYSGLRYRSQQAVTGCHHAQKETGGIAIPPEVCPGENAGFELMGTPDQ